MHGQWKRRGQQPIEVAIKLICPKSNWNTDATKKQQIFQKTLAAATKEANNIEKTRRLFREESDEDSEDVLCKVHAVVSGSLPERLSKRIRSWPKDGTLCVGILLRYEEGGSLKGLISKPRNQPIPMMERIRIAASVCKGTGAEFH